MLWDWDKAYKFAFRRAYSVSLVLFSLSESKQPFQLSLGQLHRLSQRDWKYAVACIVWAAA